MSRTLLWIVSVLGAAAIGWTAAMVAQSPAPLRDEEDAYVRFGNIMRREDAIERTELLAALMHEVDEETFPGATRAFREHLALLQPADIRLLMGYWARRDPEGVVRETSSWGDQRAERLAAAMAVYEIARTRGYAAARGFYDGLGEHQKDASLVNLTIAQINHGEMEDLAGFITSFTDSDERETVASVSLHQMMRKHGPNVVQTWVEGLRSGRGSSTDLKRIAFRASESAHLDKGYRTEFIAWLDRVGDLPWAKGGWRAVAVHWARAEPLEAIAWARTIREESGRDEVVAEAIRVWAVRQPEEAMQWILEQPPHVQLDRGTGRLAIFYSLDQPSRTFQMMERIATKKTFGNARRQVEHTWKVLPEKRREELLARSKELSRAWHAKHREPDAGAEPAEGEAGETPPA